MERQTLNSSVPSENNFWEHSLARHHHKSLRMMEQRKRKAWSFFADRFCPVTQEREEREAERKRKTNRAGGGVLREGGGGFSALACHLSLAVLRPQLLLVQSTVTGREPGTGLRKHPHSHFTRRAEEEPAPSLHGDAEVLRYSRQISKPVRSEKSFICPKDGRDGGRGGGGAF